VVEAFPQSILQMSAMVLYDSVDIVSVCSILLSLTSVITKSVVFSYAPDLKTFIFNWLSLVLDFISIFAIISWVFYNPENVCVPTCILSVSLIWSAENSLE